MPALKLSDNPHKRLNILTGDWVLVSPHRSKRPWQGKEETITQKKRAAYDKNCYLCPGNKRADTQTRNPQYTKPYSFINDFSALLPNSENGTFNEHNLLIAEGVTGICKVICFSPAHNLSLPQMDITSIKEVVDLWQNEFLEISKNSNIKYIQIFENKGEIMGCSNPHPHGQIWASSSIPVELEKETRQMENYYEANNKSLLSSYIELELQKQERIVYENECFVVLVPYWAVWPFETMIVSKRHIPSLLSFSQKEKQALADALKILTIKYDNLFQISFPYSAGMHQCPVNDGEHLAWHWHMHFYPPLLRNATVKKFMVGYEMLANPQRDITPEWAAIKLREQSIIHYETENNLC